MRLPRIFRTASFRLAFGYALLIVASAVALGVSVYVSVNSTLDRQRTDRINAEIGFLQQTYNSDGLPELTEEVQQLISTTIAGGLDYLVLGPGRTVAAGNLPFIPDATGWSDVVYPRTSPQVGEDHVRLRVVDLDSAIRLAVGDDLEPADDINAALRSAIAWWVLALVVIAAAGGALASAATRRQINAVTRTAEAIMQGDFTRRIPVHNTGDDFDRLADALNVMLDRIADLMDSLRQVSSDVAHSLRSPLTRLRRRFENVQDEVTTEEEWRSASEAAVTELDTILETFAALLRIAQVDSGVQREAFEDVDLSEVFATVSEAFAPSAEDEGKSLTTNVARGIRFVGDKDLLTQMIANLIENAIQYTPAGSHIVVELGMPGPLGVVADDGPGVSLDEKGRIFARFYRGLRSQGTTGAGLGLALVASIANLHGVEVVAQDNQPGLRIVMRFGAGAKSASPTATLGP